MLQALVLVDDATALVGVLLTEVRLHRAPAVVAVVTERAVKQPVTTDSARTSRSTSDAT